MERTDEKQDDLKGRVVALEVRVDQGFKEVDKNFKRVDKNFERVDDRFKEVKGDIAKLDTKIDGLQTLLFRYALGISTGIFVGVVAVILRVLIGG